MRSIKVPTVRRVLSCAAVAAVAALLVAGSSAVADTPLASHPAPTLRVRREPQNLSPLTAQIREYYADYRVFEVNRARSSSAEFERMHLRPP
jgi:hypothetical protein